MSDDYADIGVGDAEPDEQHLHADAKHHRRYHHRQQKQRLDRSKKEQGAVSKAERCGRAKHGGDHRRAGTDDQAVDDRPPPGIGGHQFLDPAGRIGRDRIGEKDARGEGQRQDGDERRQQEGDDRDTEDEFYALEHLQPLRASSADNRP